MAVNIERKEGQGDTEVPQKLSKRLTLSDAKAYQAWKHEVPANVRHIVEGALIGKKVAIGKEYTPLIGQFLSSLQAFLLQPETDPDRLEIDPRVKNQLKKIRKYKTDEKTFIDITEVLRNPEISFEQKLKWYKAQIEPRLKWLQQLDATPPESPAELITPNEQDKLIPSMDEMKESKEELTKGFYEVAPFYGGYYKGHVFEQWDGVNLEWIKDQKTVAEAGGRTDFTEGTARTMRGKFKIGKFQPVDLPYGFAIDRQSLKLPEHVEGKFYQDQDGVWYCKVESAPDASSALAGEVELEFEIGKYKIRPQIAREIKEYPVPAASLPSDVLQKIRDARSSSLPGISKARLLCSFVKNHLEYSNDSSCNQLYRANSSQYFVSIWNNKKADCDVANTFAAEVLRQAGLKVRLIAGHYVKSPSKAGSAILHDGTGHAWLEVLDEQTQQWERMDATPKGDPNLDEEEQEQDLQDTREGDYGEQESELMNDEELEALIKKLEKPLPPPPESPEVKFANEAGCTLGEARAVLQKINKLRQLTDTKGRNILEQSKTVWRGVVKKNLKEKVVYTGPVHMHEGEDLIGPVEAVIDTRSGEKNPNGFEERTKQVEVQKLFGGFEVYLAADLSGSMNEIDKATGYTKAEAQRDCIFLSVDSIMFNATDATKHRLQLKAPMPVKICVTVFGQKTEVVLPLTDDWGPGEQIRLYRALDQLAGGGTPDDEALAMIRTQMTKAKEAEAIIRNGLEKKQRGKKTPWEMHRFVAVFADGGSNNAAAVRSHINAMRAEGTVVYGFGVTASGRPMEGIYAPDAATVQNTAQLAEVGLQKLVEAIKKWYNL